MTRLSTTIGLLALSIALVAAIFLTRKFSSIPHTTNSVFNTPPEYIRLIKITHGSESYELKKRPPNWHINSPQLKDLADTQRINEILKAISTLTWSNRLPASQIQTNEALAPYGLKKSKLTIEIYARSRKKLLLGTESTTPGKIYARFDKSREILLVQDSLAELIPTSAHEMRSRKFSDLSTEQIDRLLIKNNLGEIEFRNSPTGWQIVKPLSAKADDLKINPLISSLLDAPVLEFVTSDSVNLAPYGIIEGQNEIVFFAEGKERPQILRFGSLLPSDPQKTYAQSTARDSIFILPASLRQFLEIKPNEFRDMRLIDFTLDAIDRIRITLPQKFLILNRQKNSWTLDSNQQTSTPDLSIINKFLDLLSSMQASQIIAQPAIVSDTLLTLELISVLSENTPEAAAGEFPIATLRFSSPNGPNCTVSKNSSTETSLLDASTLEDLLQIIDSLSPTKPSTPK